MSAYSETDVRRWVTGACALVDNVTLDYIALHVQHGRSTSWPEHASVRVESRSPEAVIADVLAHLADIAESADGSIAPAVRLKAWRAKSPAGSRTFRPIGVAGREEGPAPDVDETPVGALVSAVRELRLLAGATAAELAGQAAAGWRMAIELQKAQAGLLAELAELRAIVKLGPPQSGGGMELAGKLLSDLPIVLPALAALASERRAAAEAPPATTTIDSPPQ